MAILKNFPNSFSLGSSVPEVAIRLEREVVPLRSNILVIRALEELESDNWKKEGKDDSI
jgi:hypothetical protein